jgi:hypothetical protein
MSSYRDYICPSCAEGYTGESCMSCYDSNSNFSPTKFHYCAKCPRIHKNSMQYYGRINCRRAG